jgi:predicted thioredoxin/glutaredoxin
VLSFIITSAAAPSLMLELEAAVMVPSFFLEGRLERGDLVQPDLARALVDGDDTLAGAVLHRDRCDFGGEGP